MNIFLISIRLLFSKKQFSYTNISIFLSLFSFMLAITISLLVIGVSRGYKKNVEVEISKIEPDLVITHPSGNLISFDDINRFLESKKSILSDSTIAEKYFESYAMIKKKNNSRGIILYAMERDDIFKIFSFKNIKEYTDDDDFFFVSKTLFNEMEFTESEDLYLFNIEKMLQDESIKGIKGKISAVYESNIKTFDENVVFTSFKTAKKLFEIDDSYSGLMIEKINNNNLKYLKENSIFFHQTWREKHKNLLDWLMIFSNPIKLILIFILSLSIIYKLFTFWLILYDKTTSMNHLKILGATDATINAISYYIIILLSFLSIIFGSILALFLSEIQNKYQIITIDPNIYILSEINSIITFSDIFYLSFSSLFLLVFFTRLITYLKFRKLML